eukprot:SAG25_NODE_1605_length_2691_cov_5.083719_2_plen_208_part_00
MLPVLHGRVYKHDTGCCQEEYLAHERRRPGITVCRAKCLAVGKRRRRAQQNLVHTPPVGGQWQSLRLHLASHTGCDTQRLRQAWLRYKSTSARGGSDGTSERGSIIFSRAEGGNAPSEGRRPVHTRGHCPARPQHHATPQNSLRPSQRCGAEQRRPRAPQQCSLGNRRTPWPACPPSVALLACGTPPSLDLLVMLDIHVVAVYGRHK